MRQIRCPRRRFVRTYAGTAILFYSSDDEELLGLCDRVLVMHDGIVSAELSGERLTHSNLVTVSMSAAPGHGQVPGWEIAP
jgi:ABC-type sugar transport system ATPase subunit